MRSLFTFVTSAILIGGSWLPADAQESQLRQFAARTELHPIQSLSLTDEQFLNGEQSDARAVTVVGQFRIAQGMGRLPVVVMIHGSGGIDARAEAWSRQFNEMGVSTFVVDGFTGRGLTSVGADQTLLGRLNLIVDAYRALNILASHPRADPSKVVLMGFSRGAQAALYASLNRFHRLWNTSGITFAAYVPFYPDCSTTYLTDAEVADRPIRAFHGTPDDANPVAPCRAYVERLRGAGRDAQLTEYPNAHHGFDNPLGSPTPILVDLQTVRGCTIREEATGRLVNTATARPFTYADSCVERGAHIGHDPEASSAARQAVGALLRDVLELP